MACSLPVIRSIPAEAGMQVLWIRVGSVIILSFGFNGPFHSQNNHWNVCAFPLNAHSMTILHNGLGHRNKIPFRFHFGERSLDRLLDS
jgi:hypothetical protein